MSYNYETQQPREIKDLTFEQIKERSCKIGHNSGIGVLEELGVMPLF